MHELSIVNNIIQVVEEQLELLTLRQEHPVPPKVKSVQLEIGALSCVHPEALNFCYDLATAETRLKGSRLSIREVPVVVYCPHCQKELELTSIQSFRCPVCWVPTADIRRGKELEIVSIELLEEDHD